MFKKKDFENVENFDTLIGANTVFEGDVQSEGVVRVDGKVKGDLKINGDVFIGTNATITGNIFANDVHLSGTVEGNINAKGILRILSTAKIFGDIQVHSFVADEGGLFQGKCNMMEASESNKSENIISKKSHLGKDFKKSSVLTQIYEEREKNGIASK